MKKLDVQFSTTTGSILTLWAAWWAWRCPSTSRSTRSRNTQKAPGPPGCGSWWRLRRSGGPAQCSAAAAAAVTCDARTHSRPAKRSRLTGRSQGSERRAGARGGGRMFSLICSSLKERSSVNSGVTAQAAGQNSGSCIGLLDYFKS